MEAYAYEILEYNLSHNCLHSLFLMVLGIRVKNNYILMELYPLNFVRILVIILVGYPYNYGE